MRHEKQGKTPSLFAVIDAASSAGVDVSFRLDSYNVWSELNKKFGLVYVQVENLKFSFLSGSGQKW